MILTQIFYLRSVLFPPRSGRFHNFGEYCSSQQVYIHKLFFAVCRIIRFHCIAEIMTDTLIYISLSHVLFLIVTVVIIADLLSPALPFVVQRTYSHIFFKLVMKIIYIGIADHFRDLVNLVAVPGKQPLCFGYAYAVKIVVEIFTRILVKDFSQICAVVSENICKYFKSQFAAVIRLYILNNPLHITFRSPAEIGTGQV